MDKHSRLDCPSWERAKEALERYVIRQIKKYGYEDRDVSFKLTDGCTEIYIDKNKWDINVTLKKCWVNFCHECDMYKPIEINFHFCMILGEFYELKRWFKFDHEEMKMEISMTDKIKSFFKGE
jgi:hypothetical protein